MRIPKAQEIYRHFKGNFYQIVTVAEHTETAEQMVVYQAMYGDFRIYVRPLEMFCSKVDREKYPDVTQEYRFEFRGICGDDRENTQGVCQGKQPAVKINPGPESKEEVTAEHTEEVVADTTEEFVADPGLMEFLDAETYTQRLHILIGLHHRITDAMITTMAVASDVEVEEGDLESRYQSLKNCLMTSEKYEISRD